MVLSKEMEHSFWLYCCISSIVLLSDPRATESPLMACMLTWDSLHIKDIMFLLVKPEPEQAAPTPGGKRSGVSFIPNMILSGCS